MNDLGPRTTTEELYKLPPTLVKFIRDCTVYFGNLSVFDQYCVWRYTIGSASINKFLIFGSIGGPSGKDFPTINNAIFWTSLFFKYFNSSFSGVITRALPNSMLKYGKLFTNPENYSRFDKRNQALIAEDIIRKYIVVLNKILRGAPKVGKGGITVYKVASRYPDLPGEGVNFSPKVVKQMPFNSTTISPYFNFAPFIAIESACCLFEIHIPEGFKGVMFVPEEFHAYPFEKEILLPPGVSFDIKRQYNADLHYVDKDQINLKLIQDKNNIVMGPVYEISEYAPCRNGSCQIGSKIFTLYECVLR